jgi:pSer/pThr/pTyr-binding forkhead associated (FHA) protein
MDSSTHLPINISEGEVRIGRSRRNDVVLLRDPEVKSTVTVMDSVCLCLKCTRICLLNGDLFRVLIHLARAQMHAHYICMCVCVLTYAHIRTYMHAHVPTQMHVLTHNDALTNAQTRTHTHTQVSKRHCRIWRDARGDVYIQDLASTNGTKLNGEWLRPSGENPDSRTPSEPRKLNLGDKVILGLTTLKLDDGPAPVEAKSDGTGATAASEAGANNTSTNSSGHSNRRLDAPAGGSGGANPSPLH